MEISAICMCTQNDLKKLCKVKIGLQGQHFHRLSLTDFLKGRYLRGMFSSADAVSFLIFTNSAVSLITQPLQLTKGGLYSEPVLLARYNSCMVEYRWLNSVSVILSSGLYSVTLIYITHLHMSPTSITLVYVYFVFYSITEKTNKTQV